MKGTSINGHLVIVYLLAFIGAMGNPIILPALPFLMADLNITPLQMGMLISVYALPGALILPWYGIISDRISRRKMLFVSLTLCILGSLLCVFASDYPILLAGRAVQGISFTPLDAMGFTLATDLFEGKKRTLVIQRCSTVQFLCVASVPLVLAWIIPFCGWRSSFVFAVLLSAIAILLSMVIKIPCNLQKKNTFARFITHLGKLLVSSRLLSLFAVRILLATTIFGVIYPHLPLIMVQKLACRPDLVGFLFSLFALGMFIGSLLVPILVRHLSQIRFGLFGGLLLLLSVLQLAAAENAWVVGAALFICGIGIGILTPQNTAHVSLATTPDTRGSIMAAYSTIFRIGQAVPPIIMGLIYSANGFPGLFFSAAVIAVITGITAGFTFSYAERLEQSSLPVQNGMMPPKRHEAKQR